MSGTRYVPEQVKMLVGGMTLGTILGVVMVGFTPAVAGCAGISAALIAYTAVWRYTGWIH